MTLCGILRIALLVYAHKLCAAHTKVHLQHAFPKCRQCSGQNATDITETLIIQANSLSFFVNH